MITNTDFQKALDVINKSSQILITTHTKPDGDSCGCAVTMMEALAPGGKNIKPLLLSQVPEWYKFLFAQKPAVLGEDIKLEELKQGRFGKFDLVIIVDTSSYVQLPEFDEYLKVVDAPVLVIDHHLTTDGIGSVELIDNTAAAAGLIVFDLLKFARYPVTAKIAEALFVAVSTDTGWFQFNNTDARTHRVCAELIDAGANPSKIYHQLYQNFSPQRIKLMTKMFDTLELHDHGRLAIQHLLASDFKETGTTYSDTENLIDECRRIRTVNTAVLLVEMADGKIRCSLRSRGAVNVGQIAQKLGGGGHKMAAGVTLKMPLEQARQTIKTEVEKQLTSGK